MDPVIARITELGQSIWYDNIRRGLLASGGLQELVDAGVTGVTSNPSIFKKAMIDSDDYQADLAGLLGRGLGAMAAYETLAFEDIRQACDVFCPVYDRTDRRDGFVSIEVPPALADDTAGTVSEAKRIFAAIDRPNVMIKIPATEAGIPAVAEVLAAGINVNVTLIFSTEVYAAVIGAYLDGVERLVASGGDSSGVASVASFFVSRVDTLVDKLLQDKIDAGETGLADLRGRAAVANSKIAYQLYKQEFGGERFAKLRKAGARVQRPLWASTSTKNPEYPDLLYVEPLIGPDTVNTVPPDTLDAIRDHGQPVATVECHADDARAVLASIAEAGISMAEVTAQLKREGVTAFADAFDQLISALEARLARV